MGGIAHGVPTEENFESVPRAERTGYTHGVGARLTQKEARAGDRDTSGGNAGNVNAARCAFVVQHREALVEEIGGGQEARLDEERRREEEAKAGANRLSLRGSGDRSERIRTYNFPQNRLTDHRVDLTLYSLDRVMEGALDPVLDALRARDVDQRINSALPQTAPTA